MDERQEKLYNKYHSQVFIGERTILELMDFLASKATLTEMQLEDVDEIYLNSIEYNIKNSDAYNNLKKEERKLDFIAYKYLNNKSNHEFYHKYSNFIALPHCNDIVIIFETKTNRVTCNCTKLQLELTVYKGIDKYNFDNKTMYLLEYLTNIDFLNQLEHKGRID